MKFPTTVFYGPKDVEPSEKADVVAGICWPEMHAGEGFDESEPDNTPARAIG